MLFYQTDIFKTVFEWLSLTWQFAWITSWTWRFLDIDISQGSVATRLRCGRIFKYGFITHLLQSLTVKEVSKYVKVCRSYGQKCVSCFFDSQYSTRGQARICTGWAKKRATDSWPYFCQMLTDLKKSLKIPWKICSWLDIKNSSAPCMRCYTTVWSINVSKTRH